MATMKSITVLKAAALSLSLLVGCGEGDPGRGEGGKAAGGQPAAASDTPDPGATGTSTSAVTVFPTTVYTGSDGTGTGFQVPVVVVDGKVASWTCNDPTMMRADGVVDHASMLPLTDGTSTVTAVGEDGSTALVTVVTFLYTQEQLEAGKGVYTNICSNCHAAGGDGPDITPSGVGKHTQDQILGAALMGMNPEGGPLNQPNHMFQMTDLEKHGIVGYLRSLPPRGLPDPNDT
jgi:hypothetical protein